MSTIAAEIMAIATEHGYEGATSNTIAGAINILADTLAGEDATDGSTIAGTIKALAPYVGEVPSGTISITENGTDIDVSSYAKADVSVSGGGSFGELQAGPFMASAKPTVGGAISGTGLTSSRIGQSGQTSLVVVFSTIDEMASGLYFITDSLDNVDTVDAYVCEVEMQGSALVYTSVTEWDGQIDPVQAEGFAFGFTMPNLGGFDPETELPVAVLVFHVYKAD